MQQKSTDTALIIIMCLGTLAIAPTLSLANDSLTKAIVEAHTQRFDLFDNGHFVWNQVLFDGGVRTDFTHEYWARNGEYFRLDSRKSIDGQQQGKIYRTIVRPDGFAKISADTPEAAGAIIDFGTADAGLKAIRNNNFIAIANFSGFSWTKTWIDAWPSRSRDLIDLRFTKLSEDEVKMTFVRKDEDGTKTYNSFLASDDYRVLRWTYRFDSTAGNWWADNVATYTYHPSISDLVAERSVEISNTDSETPEISEICTLVSYDPAPAAVSVFEIGSMPGGHRPPQNRRLITFAMGVLLLSGWIYYRKRSQHR